MFVTPVVSDEYSYSHLLGLCLLDGREQLFGLVDVAETSVVLLTMGRLGPGWRATTADEACGGWGELFPQVGARREYRRAIVLEPWQQLIVDREPEAFLRGLIQSDGCRVINRFTTRLRSGRLAHYAYPRYFFTSESADVRGLFCASCERIGADWTQSNRRTISVANRRSVALLDAFAGPTA